MALDGGGEAPVQTGPGGAAAAPRAPELLLEPAAVRLHDLDDGLERNGRLIHLCVGGFFFFSSAMPGA